MILFELCEVDFDSICTSELEFTDFSLVDELVLLVAGDIVLEGLLNFNKRF